MNGLFFALLSFVRDPGQLWGADRQRGLWRKGPGLGFKAYLSKSKRRL